MRIGRLPVVVRHVGAETNPCIGTPAGMAISALQHLGRDHVSEDVVRHLSAVLAPADKRRLDAARPRLPGWLGAAAAQIAAA